MKDFYTKNYAPNVSFLTVVGDVDPVVLTPQLGFLESWAQKPVSLPPPVAATPPDKTRIYFVGKDGAVQSEIRVGYLTAMPYDATGDYHRAYLANYLLGGAFNSRVSLNLREDKGYTYGASTDFHGSAYPGPFTARAAVRADATAPAVREFMKEITNYPNGISDEELRFLQTSIGQGDALEYETGQQKAAFLGRIAEYDLAPTFVDAQSQILKKLTKEDVQAAAKKHLPADRMYIVVVGDRQQLPAVQALGYEVVELDADGNRLAVGLAAPATSPDSMTAPENEKPKTKSRDGWKRKTKNKGKQD